MEFDFTRIAERKIEEAIAEGAFDNLPGKGQPLVLDNTPAHLRILKNANVLPDWLQIDRDIEDARRECLRLRAQVAREYRRKRERLRMSTSHREATGQRQEFDRWRERRRTAFRQAMQQVNLEILKLNLISPAFLRAQIPFDWMRRWPASTRSSPHCRWRIRWLLRKIHNVHTREREDTTA